jgi:hypothetical protein
MKQIGVVTTCAVLLACTWIADAHKLRHKSIVKISHKHSSDNRLLDWRKKHKWPFPDPDYKTIEFDTQTIWKRGLSPLTSCNSNSSHTSEADRSLNEAVQIFCNAGLGELVEFYVHPDFEANYRRLVDAEGWIPEAFVTYVRANGNKAKVAAQEDVLVRSIHHFSHKPVVVALFGSYLPESFKVNKFPNLVVMQGRDCHDYTDESFNFNKMTSMIFTKVRAGMVLDADQFVNAGVDKMFPRISEETTKEYPYPIMPAHWMSRDPQGKDMIKEQREYAFNFVSYEAPVRTMHWGHAHPTWTYYAFPWLAQWTSYALRPVQTKSPHWLQVQGHLEDEDVLNMGLWASKATKQWCKFDLTSPDEFKTYVKRHDNPTPHPDQISYDGRWYPRGIALLYYTAHDAKDPAKSADWLQKLWQDDNMEKQKSDRSILYDGHWFSSAHELYAYDPNLKCLV